MYIIVAIRFAIELELKIIILIIYYLHIFFSYMPLKTDRLVTRKHKFHFLQIVYVHIIVCVAIPDPVSNCGV